MTQIFYKSFESNTIEALEHKMNDWVTAFDVDCEERGLKYSIMTFINPPYVIDNRSFFTSMLNVEVDDGEEEEV